MTYLRSPSGDCFHCREPYSLHDSCTDQCPRERSLPSLDGAAHLEGAPSAPSFLAYEQAVERVIRACELAMLAAPDREKRRTWQSFFYTALGMRCKPARERMEAERLARVGT